jgi:hypothetical protein
MKSSDHQQYARTSIVFLVASARYPREVHVYLSSQRTVHFYNGHKAGQGCRMSLGI